MMKLSIKLSIGLLFGSLLIGNLAVAFPSVHIMNEIFGTVTLSSDAHVPCPFDFEIIDANCNAIVGPSIRKIVRFGEHKYYMEMGPLEVVECNPPYKIGLHKHMKAEIGIWLNDAPLTDEDALDNLTPSIEIRETTIPGTYDMICY